MINISLAKRRFSLFAELSLSDAEEYSMLVEVAVAALEGRTKDSIDYIRYGALLATAAAADAYYNYCLLLGSHSSGEVTAGSVTVKKDISSKVSTAKLLRDAAFAPLVGLLRDGEFAFICAH